MSQKDEAATEKGTWVKYGGFHAYSLMFGVFAGCSVSFLYMAVKVF